MTGLKISITYYRLLTICVFLILFLSPFGVKKVYATNLATLSFSSSSSVTTASGNVSDTSNTVFLTAGVTATTYTFYWANTATGQTVNLGTCSTAVGGSTCNRPITVPHATQGNWLIHAESMGGVDISNNQLTFTVNPKLTASSPSSGNVGTSVIVAGTGFASESVSVKLGTFTLGSATPTSGAGGAAGDLSVTAGAPEMPKSTYAVSATGIATGTVTSSFTFVMNPKISITSTSGVVGATTSVSGNGFAASSTITITLDGIDTATTTTSNSLGTFTVTTYTPTGSGGGHDISARDAVANSASSIRYVIINPTITLSVSSGNAGNVITIDGNAFKPSSTVTITFDGSTTSTTTTSNATNGAFSGLSFTIPAAVAGNHNIGAKDVDNNTTPNQTYAITPKITLSVSSGIVGSTTVVTGTGFAASSAVSIKWDGSTSGPTIQSNSTGGFSSLNFFVPTSVAGSHTVGASDTVPNSSNNVTYTVTQSVTISSSSGYAGDTTILAGTGFAASSTITVKFKGADTATTTTSTAQGTFSGLTFTIPSTETPASDTITARDAASNTAPNKTYAVTVATTPVMTVSAASGNVSNTITLTGKGFGALATSATVKWDGTNTATTCTVSGGNISSCSYTIPAAVALNHTISATDNASIPNTSATQNYNVIPKITPSSTSGTAGTIITISGTGFAATSTTTITWDNADTSTTTTSSSTGGFSGLSFTIPASGSHTIGGRDASRNFANNVSNSAGGTLSMTTGSSTTLVAVTLAASPQNGTGSLGTITVTDTRGTNAGWSVTATASNFTSGSRTITVTNLAVNPNNSTLTVISGSGVGVSAGSSHTYTSTSDAATIITASSGNGDGQYSVNPALTLTVPVGSYAGTYTGTITETVL